MKTDESQKNGLQELKNEELIQISGGYSWFWQAAAATFLYNVVADWEANVAAFNAGQAAAEK